MEPKIVDVPMTGIRQATVAPQEELIAKAREVLAADERVLAAWLVGSFATGQADPFSDVDLHCLVTDASAEELRCDWRQLVEAITPVVLAEAIPGVIGGYCLTPEWRHIDLVLFPEAGFDPDALTGMTPLFDRTGRLPTAPVPGPGVEPAQPYFPAGTISWFFYMLGNLVVVAGREELVLATNGVITIRDTALVPLMLAERGIVKSGGNKRLNPFLTDEQRKFLESLPPLEATWESIVTVDRLLTADFLRRGHRLAEVTGSAWPQGLEDATLDHLERGLGVSFRD